MTQPRLWNVVIRYVDETKGPLEVVVLAEVPSRALDAACEGHRFDEIDKMTVCENGTSIDIDAWSSRR